MGINYIVKNDSGRKSQHAEENLIQKFLRIRNRPKKLSLLIVKVTKSGNICMSRPCRNCMKRLIAMCNKHDITIKNVYYSTNDDIMYERFDEMVRDLDGFYVATGFV